MDKESRVQEGTRQSSARRVRLDQVKTVSDLLTKLQSSTTTARRVSSMRRGTGAVSVVVHRSSLRVARVVIHCCKRAAGERKMEAQVFSFSKTWHQRSFHIKPAAAPLESTVPSV
jgi:hypothetical protein